jgi:hypothetical protein
MVVQASLGKKEDVISTITRAKRAGGMNQVVEHLLSKYKPQYCQGKKNQ